MQTHAQSTERQREAFTRLSHDRNPLHCDPLHAHRTPYGRVVQHGMATVLAALGAWADGRRLQLDSMRGRFARPMFVGEDYALAVRERGNAVTLQLLRGRALRAEVTFTWRPLERQAPAPPAPFVPLAEAGVFTESSPRHYDRFAYEAGPWGEAAAFGLGADQLPRHQLSALAGASYLVGMVVPGRRALFSDFAIAFEPAEPGPFEFRNLEVELEPRFNQVRVSGAGTGIRALQLTAFRRPEPCEFSTEEIREGLRLEGRPFAGQTALVTGASRGFGAVLAQGLALGGAEVLLHYRSCEVQARRVGAQIKAAGGKAWLCRGDLSQGADCVQLFDQVRAQVGGLDLVIHNASEPACAEGFFDQRPDEVVGFIHRALELNVHAAHALLPAVRRGGQWVTISSAFTQRPEPRFAHYIAAKSAIEGLFRGLAAELKGPQIILARPPRMLTDQTNLPFVRAALASPIAVAKQLLERLLTAPAEARCWELDLGLGG